MVNKEIVDKNTTVFTGDNPNVWKYVFDFDGYPTEAVLYRYPDFNTRTVLCISTQCGCPVGCTFCGTGNRFLKNLEDYEIVDQVQAVFEHQGLTNINSSCAKLQIMFMSMGEPFLNYENVNRALTILNTTYPNADLLISTIAPKQIRALRHFSVKSKMIDKIGLQFSVHRSTDNERDKLIPYKNKLTLRELRNYGVQWFVETGRKAYINYCIDGKNATQGDVTRLMDLFPPNVFCFTFSVVCSADETMRDAGYRDLEYINDIQQEFIQAGYDTRVFDPAGQDDLGGGCGQLWYVQRKMKEIEGTL